MNPFDQPPVRRRDGVSEYCTQVHARKVSEDRWGYDRDTTMMGVVVHGNGREAHYLYCSVCDSKTSEIPKAIVELLMARGMRPSRRRVRPPIVYPPCSYYGCTSDGVDWHHFGPSNTFADARRWPIMPLCKEHHRIWHQTMDGYQWRAKTPAWHERDHSEPDWFIENRVKLTRKA